MIKIFTLIYFYLNAQGITCVGSQEVDNARDAALMTAMNSMRFNSILFEVDFDTTTYQPVGSKKIPIPVVTVGE